MTKSTAMYQDGPAPRGPSHIPQPVYRRAENSFSSGYSSHSSVSKQSRLEMLQADYQHKLLKEKEEKMMHMYEDNQKRALDKIGGSRQTNGRAPQGGVRKFFSERRALAEQPNRSGVPPIHQHYSQYQQSQNGHTTMQKAYNSRSAPQPQRHSAGRDRANPLAPIDKRAGYNSPSSTKSDQAPRRIPVPPIQQKPRIYQRKPTGQDGGVDRNGNKVYQGQIYTGSNSAPSNTGNAYSEDDEGTPSPDLRNLKVVRHKRPPQKRGSDQTSNQGNESPQKLTDFQKWQLEQNKTREERLEKRRQQQQSGSRSSYSSERDEHDLGNDVNEEIRRKQEELQARLEAQKNDLKRIQMEREREEEKERQKKARQQKAQAAERERQKREAEQRQKQKEAELERKRKQEERRHEEEERRRHEEDQRRESRLSHQSGATFNRYSAAEEDSPHNSPPRKIPAKNPKPAAARRRVNPPRQRSPTPQQDEDNFIVPGPSIDIYAQAANDSEAFGGKIDLAPCRVCGRRFAKERLAKHQSACKTVSKPRKVFDPVKMRTEGTEAAQYVRGNKHQREPPKTKKKANWRAQHESFIESIRYAKKMTQYEAEGKNVADLPPPPRSDTSDYVQCPHCNRKFNAAVAERHIPKCVNIRAKPRPPPGKRR